MAGSPRCAAISVRAAADASAAWLAMMVLTAMLASVPLSASRGGIVNGGFETGDLSGWTANDAAYAGVSSGISVMTPYAGTYFGYVETGLGDDTFTLLSQTFSVNAGDRISGYAAFLTDDFVPFNDVGYVAIKQSGTETLLDTVFTKTVADVGDGGFSGWTVFTYTFATAGSYYLEAGAANIRDNSFSSYLGLDAVSVTAVPVPAALPIIGAALAVFGCAGWRRQRGVA